MLNWGVSRDDGGFLRLAKAVVLLGAMLFGPASAAAEVSSAQAVEIAVALALTGEGISYGKPTLEGVQLAIEEANASSAGPPIKIVTYDDQSSDETAKAVARRVVASPAWLMLGPVFSTASLAAGPVYAEAGLASLPPTATSDLITQNATTFRVIFKNSDQGETLATYLFRVLGQRRAAVFVVDSGYGHTLQEGFERTAGQLGIDAQYYRFATDEQAEPFVQQIAADPSHPAVVFLTLDPEGARLLTKLRRLGVTGPFLGGDAFGDESFSQLLANQSEERTQPGYFSDNLYGLAPVILDSANANILAFAERFRARFGHDPVWFAIAGYDAANLAVAAVRAVAANNIGVNADLKAQRTAVLAYLLALNHTAKAQPGLLGPFWFDEARARQQVIRVGRFHGGRFASAPVQFMPVANPDPAEIASGTVFELGPGRYARLQRVVYTGVFLNEIPRIDLAHASFNADFYLWLRFARDAGPDSADPTDLIFPNLISGSFDRTRPAELRKMADGSEYWLWRVQGEFRNDFDLHHFPFDRQALSLSFFNARAPMERIVYVLDKRTAISAQNSLSPSPNSGNAAAATQPAAPAETLAIASPDAFRNLTQWEPLGARSRRENLVTHSALGDPRRTGVESYRELSGFLVTVEVARRAVATLVKSLLPLLLMALIMYASLYFPSALLKEKVSVAITGALSGAVLLSAINSQLGGIGYTIAVEYVFYVFFALSLLCIISVLSAERLRVASRSEAAVRTVHWTRMVFALAVVGTVVGALGLYWSR